MTDARTGYGTEERLVLMSEPLFAQWLREQQDTHGHQGETIDVDWGQPVTRVVTYYTPVITVRAYRAVPEPAGDRLTL